MDESRSVEPSELDLILELLENPVRRKIVERLTEEPGYSLQISKELRLGQQLVSSHLDLMEQAGLLQSKMEESPHGPKRRSFLLHKSVSLTIDVGPHLFNVAMRPFDESPRGEVPIAAKGLKEAVDKVLTRAGEKGNLGSFIELFSKMDAKIKELETERAALLSVRNYAKQRVSALLSQSGRTLEERRILYRFLEKDDRTIEKISEALNVREGIVRQMVRELEEATR